MNNKNTKLQFTELTPDDIATHEDLYISLMINNGSATIDKKYQSAYYEYIIKEVQKANDIFQKTFN